MDFLISAVKSTTKITLSNISEIFLEKFKLNVKLIHSQEARTIFCIEEYPDVILKLAKDRSEVNQNKAECHPAFSKYADVFNIPLTYNQDCSLILSPKAEVTYTKLSEEETVRKFFNVDEDFLISYFDRKVRVPNYTLKDIFIYVESNLNETGSKFVKAFIGTHKTYPELSCWGLPADYAKGSSYGLVKGNLKIIDFGLTDYTYI